MMILLLPDNAAVVMQSPGGKLFDGRRRMAYDDMHHDVLFFSEHARPRSSRRHQEPVSLFSRKWLRRRVYHHLPSSRLALAPLRRRQQLFCQPRS